jgi:hypothetical protein
MRLVGWKVDPGWSGSRISGRKREQLAWVVEKTSSEGMGLKRACSERPEGGQF